MISYKDVMAIRNLAFKISRLGYNTGRYEVLRNMIIETSGAPIEYIPEIVIQCTGPTSVRKYLSDMFPNDEKGSVYKRRRHFLGHSFAELIHWSEQTALLPIECAAIEQIDCADRATMDDVLEVMCECAKTDPRRSLTLCRQVIYRIASDLLASNGAYPDITSSVRDLIEQIANISEISTESDKNKNRTDEAFLNLLKFSAKYVDQCYDFCSWEEGNRKPTYPTPHDAHHFYRAAALLCEVLWQWTLDDIYQSNVPRSRADGRRRMVRRFR